MGNKSTLIYYIFAEKAPQARKNRVFSHFFRDFRGPGSDKKSRIFKPPRFAHFLGLELYFKLESGVKIELNNVKMGQNVDFRVKKATNTAKTA